MSAQSNGSAPVKLPSEHAEQAEVVKWFRRTYPGIRIFAIPNGGWRSKTTALKLKVEGASPGVPDLCIPQWLLWVEMKRIKGGVVSPEQRDWLDYLNGIGHTAIVCAGADAAKDAIEKFYADRVTY